MANKQDKSRIFVRIMAAILALLMIIGVSFTLIYYIILMVR